MPVLFDSSVTSSKSIAGAATSGNTSATHKVNPAATNVYALVAVYWAGNVDATGATFAVTFGGQSMTLLSGSKTWWNSNKTGIMWFYLADPPSGPQTVTASFSGMGTEGGNRIFGFASGTYWGVASISPVTTASGASASLAVPSAEAVLFANAFGCFTSVGSQSFSSYSGSSRHSVASAASVNEPLIIGDVAGAAVANFTATAPGPNQWGAIGCGLLGATPAYDSVGAGGTGYLLTKNWSHTIGASATAAITALLAYRSATASLVATAKIGTTPMDLLGSIPFAPSSTLYLFGLLNPPTGAQTCNVTLPGQRYLSANSVAYTGVSDFDDAVVSTYGNNVLAVSSGRAASRVVCAHGITPFKNVFGYNQTKRAVFVSPNSSAEQILLLGDAPGSPTVLSQVQMSAGSPNWGAIGVNLDPAPVLLNVSTKLGAFITKVGLADYRVADPSPLRTWVIPDTPGKLSDGTDPPPFTF